jgi:hypothetical protein
MAVDWNKVILPIIQQIVIPEIFQFIKRFRDKNGVDPTEEEVKRALEMNVTEGLTIWEAWFNAHE